jgi:hypothetical protein
LFAAYILKSCNAYLQLLTTANLRGSLLNKYSWFREICKAFHRNWR